jgi:predicted nucleotidyltransferase
MRRNDAVQILQEQAQALMDSYPISALFLFGSVARDEAHEDSDVDILDSISGWSDE